MIYQSPPTRGGKSLGEVLNSYETYWKNIALLAFLLSLVPAQHRISLDLISFH